jgi:hypothetical protein
MEIRSRFVCLLFCISTVVPLLAVADSDADMERMQRSLNEQVMQKPFSVEDQARVDAYVNDAMKRNLPPVQTPPSYWRPGYTCNSIIGYGWRAYGDCYYYHRYYGRYW